MNLTLRLAFLAALFVASCASQRAKTSRMEQGAVKFVLTNIHHQEIDHVQPLWNATWMGLLGSAIGSGGTANAIGAGGGALLGAGLSYLSQANNAKKVHRMVDAQSDISGITYRIRSSDPTPLLVGQKIWITFDKHGVADRVIPYTPGMMPRP